MDYKVKGKEKNVVTLEITLKMEEWEKEVDASYNRNKGKFSIEGFRKGKAPRKVIEKAYGDQVFYEDALQEGFQKAYMELLSKEKDIEPIDAPDVTIKKFDKDGVVIEATVQVRPEVKNLKYKGLGISVKAKSVTAKDVEEALKQEQEKHARFVEKDTAIENGNIANIDFKGSVDGKLFDGGTAEGYDLEIGSHSFIDTFEDQLVGLKANDTKDVMVTFPENYHVADLAGKPAKFEVKVNAVKAKELPEISDAFVSDISEFETLDAYKEHIKADLKKRNEESAKMETENKIIEAIVKEMEVDVPEVMINDELDNIMRDMEYRLMYQGANLETYAKYMNKTVEELRQDRRADAEKSVKVRLALQNILALEKIDIKDKEIDAKIEEIATRVNKPLDEYKKTISEERVSYIKNQILMDKLLAFLVDNNK